MSSYFPMTPLRWRPWFWQLICQLKINLLTDSCWMIWLSGQTSLMQNFRSSLSFICQFSCNLKLIYQLYGHLSTGHVISHAKSSFGLETSRIPENFSPILNTSDHSHARQVMPQTGLKLFPKTDKDHLPNTRSYWLLTLQCTSMDRTDKINVYLCSWHRCVPLRFEIFMQYDTAVHFNVEGHANYKPAQAQRALEQTASFISDVLSKAFETTVSFHHSPTVLPDQYA